MKLNKALKLAISIAKQTTSDKPVVIKRSDFTPIAKIEPMSKTITFIYGIFSLEDNFIVYHNDVEYDI